MIKVRSFRFGAVLQGILLASAAFSTLGAALLATDVDAAAVCAAPGRDTIPTSGIVNSYWGGASATNGGTNATIALGNQRTGTSNTPFGVTAVATTGISAGDLLIVMQMQGPTAGSYEYVTAVSPAGPTTSGSITVRGAGTNGGLLHNYTQSFSAGSTFQVIRVPQTLNSALGNYTSAAWDVDASGYGTGGVFALDVAQQATLNGTVNVVGQGFRGGAGFNLAGNDAAINSSTTAYPAGSKTGGSKAEGTSGTPGYVFDGYAATIKQYSSTGLTNAAYSTAANAAPSGTNDNGNYGGNSFGFGAIGNAGGGGNDAAPATGTNQYNSGGAGGGNAGRGGQGGWTWLGNSAYCTNVGYTPSQCPFVTNEGITDGGGRGGSAVGGLSAGMVTLGGGGGAASENNNPDASTINTYPPIDIAVDPTTLSGGSTTVNNGAGGPISASGGRGGGIVLIRAGTFNAAAGQILADGVRAYNQFGSTASEAAGGGGGGGAIVVLAQAASGTLQTSAVGGRGGDPDYYAHGPGGGGGGGYVLTNFSVGGSVDKGGSGYVPKVGTYPANFPFPNHYGTDAVDGIAGYMSASGGTTPGTLSGSVCSPDVAATVTLPASGAIGATINGSFNYLDNGPSDATGVGYAATLSAGLGTVTFGTITLNGVAVAGASATYNNTTGAITFTGLPSTLPNTQSLVVPIGFTMPANGTSVTGTDAVSEATTDPVPSNNNGTATVNGTPQDDDAVTITGLPTTAAPSAAIFGVLNFVNNGPSISNGTTYTAKLPVGAAVSSIKYNGTTLAGASATVGSDGTVTFTGLPATLNPSDSVTVAFNATMPASGASTAATATIASSTTDSNTSNNTASAIVTGQGSADLATTITGVPTSAQAAGSAFTGSVNFQNNGPSTAVTPVYTVQVPPGSSISASQVLYNGTPINGLTVTIDQYGNVTFGGTGLPTSLANGDKITIAFNATMPADGSNANVVSSISSATTDPNTGNNNATATVTGIREADLQSTVTGFATFAQTAGTTESGMITFANNGPSSATGVTYTSTLSGTPTSVTLGTPTLNGVAIAGATATYNAATGAITYSGLPTNLNSGDKITVPVSFPMPGNPVTVSSNISSNTTDPVTSNNAGSQTINGGNDLAVALTNWPTTAQAAATAETSTVTYSIVSGSAAAPANYTPVLTLTPGLTGVTITGTQGVTATYNATSGVVTFGGTLPTLTVGGTANFVLTVKYTMPASNVVAQASISENPNIDTYAANNSATATVPGSAVMTDVATTITGLGGVAAAGSTVSSGVINFTNAATNISTGDSFAAKLPVGATVTAITLNGVAIAGASAVVGSDGTVTFTGMPTTMATSAVIAVAFSFPMPANGSAATATATVTSTNDNNAANNTATATETGDAPTDLQTKVTQPATAAPNATLSGTLDFLNNGPANAVNPTYQMTLEVAGGTPTITSVMLNGSLLSVTTSIAANGVVTFTNMPTSLSPGDDLKVAYTYKTPASGSVSTTGQITYPGTDTVPGNNAATGTTTVTANAPTVMVTKTVDHTTHNAGDSVNWTLTVTNTGTSATSGVITLTDTLPNGITNIVITPSSGTTCSPANPTAGTTLTCSVPAGLAASGGVATVGIAATLPTAGTYNNSVTPSGNAADNPTCASNACSTVTVVGSATMQVFKTSINGTGTFGYALTNMSATTDSISTASQNTSTPGVINVVTTLTTPITINENSSPAGYAVTSASCVDSNSAATGNTGTFGTLAGTTLTIPVANIKQNSTLQCTFVNTVTESITIAKSGPTTMTVGTAYNYVLTVTNSSAAATVTTATVSDQLPANFTFNSGSGNGWTCSAVAQLVSCSFAGSIAKNGTSTINISATPNATSASAINSATVDGTGGTNPAAAAGCTASTTCAKSAAATITATGLSIAKSAPAPGLMPNANSVYTLTVTNNGATAATAVTLRDQLPTQLTYVSALGTGWTCTNASGLISCTFAGSIAAGGTSQIAVTVRPASQAVVGTSVTNYASLDPTGGTNPPTPGSSCTPTTACASQTSTVGGPNVMVTKTVDQASHSVGDTITWTLKAANTGGAASTAAITLTDTLPSGISNIVATPSAGTTCLPATPTAGGTLTCTVPAGLPATTGVATVTITATAVATGSITNSVVPSGTDNPTCATGACSATTMVGGQSVTLQKALNGPRAANSDQFTVQISSGASVVASATTTGSGNAVANGSTGATAVTVGTAYTLGEIAAGTTTLTNYSAALACSNANASSTTTLPTTVGGSVTPAAGDRITCTITNSAAPIVTLVKALGTPRVHDNDQFTVQIANGATVVGTATTTGTGSSLAANSTGAVTLVGGTSYTLKEIASGGTQLAQYTSALACSNSTTGSATVLPTTVPGTLTPATGDNISCTLTNTAKPPVVTYLGTLTGNRAANTDQFTLAIANGATTVATTTTTGTGNTLTNNTTGAQTLVSGTSYTLTEAAAGTTNLAQYTSTLSCTNTDASSTTTLPTTLPATLVPAVGDNITCTAAIVPKVPTATLTKALGSNREAANDQFTLQINAGATNVATATTTGAGNALANQTVGPTALTPGVTYTLTEVAAGGANLAQYTQALACSNSYAASTTLLPNTVPGNVTPQDADIISCTLTNTGVAILTTSKALTSVNGAAPGASVKDNDVLLYTVTVQNTGATSGSTLVTETVPPGTSYTGSGEGWSASCTVGGTSCTQTITAGANASATKPFTVTVAPGVTASSIVNTVTTSNGTCSAACQVTTPVSVPALATTKTLFSVNGAAPGATVKAGDILLYHIATQNTGGSTGATTLTETVPAGSAYTGTGEGWGAGCTNAGTTCAQTVNINGGATVTENYTITVSSPTTTTTIANTVASTVGTCGASCTVTTNVASADLQTTVSYTTTPVNAGSTATANIVFTNAGPSTAATVTYGTTLTTGLTNVTFPTLPGGVTAAYNAGTGAVTFTGLPTTLTSGQTENISISYTQPGAATSSVTTNIASVTRDPNSANNTATATVTGTMEADVTTSAAYTSGTVAGGATATLNLTFSNNGPSSAAAVTYTTTLTTGLANVAFPTLPTGVTAAYNAATGAVTFTGLPTTLTAAQSEAIQITYTQPAAGASTVNTAIATSSAETNTTNNTATATTAGTPEADVTTTAAYTSGTVAGGATATLNLTFSNNGPGSAAGVTYTTTLTTGLANVAFPTLPTGVTAAYNAATGVVTFTGLPTTLTSAQSEAIQITYTQPVAGTSTVNTAIATTTTETNSANNTATATTAGAAEADVTTTAAYTSGTVAGGATATLNLTFSNNGPGAAAGVTYTTTLTTGLTNVAFPTLPTGVTAAYNAATGAVTFTGLPATLTAAQSEAIQITYTQPAAGTSTVNTAIATTTTESNTSNNTATATTAGAGEADVTTTAAYTSGTVAGGATATLNLTFSNNGPGSAAGVTYTTTLTAGLANVAFPTLPTGVTAAYNAATGAVTFIGLPTTLTAAQSEAIQITYTQPAAGTSTVNTAIATTTTETNAANDTATATTAGAAETDVTTTAAYTSGTVAGGATATLNLTFSNNGPGAAAGVTYTTTLTTGLTNVAFPTLPTGVTAAYNAATGAVTFTGLPATLTAAQSEAIQITYTQPAAGTSTVNTAIATTTTESNTTNNTATATTAGAGEADVTTTAAYTSGTVAGGATATLNLTFSNNGPGSAAGVTYTTTLTTGLTNVAFPTLPAGVTAAYNQGTGVVTFTGLPTTLTSGQAEAIQITYTQPAAGTSTVNTSIATTTTETNAANNTATATTTGAGEADVTTTAAYTGSVAGGATATLNLTFSNNGPGSAAGVTYTTTLTTGLANVAFPTLPAGVTAAYNAATGAVTFTGLPATLTAAQSEAIQITYTQPVSGTSTVNTAIATTTTETNAANNTATATTTGAGEADVTTTAAYTSGTVAGGATATLNLAFINNGPGAAAGVTYTTTLTTGLTNVAFPTLPAGVTAAYNAATGVVTFSGLPASLASGQTENIQATYTQPVAGTSTVNTSIATTTTETNSANNTATATTAGAAEADVTTTAAYTSGTVAGGATATLNLTFSNNGPGSAAGVTYTTSLTTGLTNVAFPSLPTGVTAAYNAATGVVTFTGLPTTLTSGQTENIQVTYTQPATGTSTVNSSIATTTTETNTANDSASATTAGAGEADVTTTAAYTSGTVAGGATATLNLTFVNNGPASAAGVTYGTTLTTGLTNVAFPTLPTGVTAAYNAATGAVTFTGLPTTLTSGQSEAIQATYTQPVAGTSTVNTTIATTTPETNTTNNAATATTTGAPEADVTTTAAYTSGTVAGGATATLNLSFSNNGPGSAAGVTTTTTLTTGLTNVAFPTLPTGVTAAYNAATGAVTFTGLPTTLTSGQAENIQITYTQPAAGSSTVNSAIATTTAETNTANDTASATTSGTGEADVTTTDTYTAANVNAGSSATVNVVYKNNGPATAAAVTYTTTLTTGLAGVTFPTLPTGVTAAYNAGTGAVTFTGLPTTLTSGQTENISISYTQPGTATSTINTAIATSSPETSTTNNAATATITGTMEADVTTTAAYTSGTVAGGATATLNLAFLNNGPSSAAGVSYTTTLTTGLTNVAFPTLPTGVAAAYNAATGAVTFTGLPTTLTSGQSENIQITYTQPAAGSSTVNTAIGTSTAETNTANDTASATTAGAGEADVTTTDTYTAANVNSGSTATVNVVFTNNGPAAAAGVTYTTTLTTGLANVTFPTLPAGVTGAYNAASGAVTFTGLPTTLTSGQSENISISYTQPGSGTSSINSAIATSTTETNTANNTANATITGTMEADVTTTAAYTSGTVAGGATATLNLAFLNNGPSSATGVTYTTGLTPGLTNVAFPTLPAGVTAAYNAATGAVTFTGLPTTLTSGQSENIQLTYTQPASGTSTVNTAITTTAAETNTTNNSATATTTGTGEADVTTSDSYTAASVNAGAAATVNVVFTNNGPGTAAAVTYTTTLTTGLAGVTFPTLPAGVTAAYNAATGAVTFTGLPVALTSGQTENISISYTQPSSATSSITTLIATSTTQTNTANDTASATITGVPEADVATTSTFPATVNAGSPVAGTITFTNNGPSPAAGVTYTTTLSPGLTNVTFPTLPAGVTASYNPTNGVVTYTGLPTALPSGTIETIGINYTQPAAGTSTVNPTIATTTADPNTANNTATSTIGGVPEADVATTSTFPASVNAGSPVTGTITFTNNGPSPAAGVTYTTTLSPGLTNVTFPTLPAGVTASYNPTNGVVTYSGLPTALASGTTETIGISYTQPASGTSTVNPTIATTTADPNTANNTATSTINGAMEADVATTASYTPATANAGATATANVTFSNNGPSPAVGVTYTTVLTTGLAGVTFPTLPAGVTASYNAGNGQVTYTGLPTTLASGATESIAISYTQPAAATSTINTTVATTAADPNTANNAANATVAGAAEADLVTTTTFPAAAGPMVAVSGTVVFTNNGPSPATGVTYTTTLSPGLTNVTFPTLPAGVTAAYNPTSGVVTYTGLPTTLASGATETIGISYTQPASGASTTVQGGVSATTADPAPANNTSNSTITGNAQADLATTLTVPATVNAGQPVNGTVGFNNNGPSSATAVVYALTLPTGLTTVTFSNLPAGVTANYNPTTGVVTFTGLPTTLTSGQTIAPIGFAYAQPASGTSTVTSGITSATTDPTPANNNATGNIGGTPQADTSAVLTLPANVNAGGTVTGTLVFANAGPSTANAMTYGLTLSAGLTNVTFPTLPAGVTATYNATTGVVTFTGLPATLTSGQSVPSIGISYTQPPSGTSAATATIGSSTADPNTANNTANATVGGNPEADTSTVLNFPANVAGLQPVSGTVTFANAGPSIANGVTYTLTLNPNLANVTFANLPAGVTATYNAATGAVTFTGLPTVLGVNQSVGPITVNYTQPPSGTSSVTGVIGSTTADPNTANNSATSNVVGTAATADLAIQTSAPATVAPDGSLIYTLTITNNGPGAANNATFSDTLPAVLGVPTASCASASAGVTCGTTTVTGKTVSGALTSLPSGGTAIITITTTAPASGTFTDTATVSAPTGITDPVPANNTSSATTTVGAVPNNVDLSVTSSGTTSVQPNGTVSYVVDVVNGGPSAANNAVFNYSTATPVTNVTWTCVAVGGGAVCPAASGTGNTINQTIATFPDGGHLEYTITGKAPAAPQQFVDTATITAPAGVTETNQANNTATTTTNVQAAAAPSADVATTINGPSTVQPGAPVVYTVVVTDNGPAAANGATLAVPVASQVTNVTTTCVASGGAVCPTVAAGNNISTVIPTLPNGGQLTFTVTGTAPQSGTFDTSATVTPPTGTNDPVPSNNTAGPVVTTVPNLSADLSIQKNGPAQVLANGVINYTIIVSNAGPNAGDGATVTDVLPAGLTNASVTCSAATGGAACGTAAITGGTLHAVAGALPAAGSITLTVSATAPASGTLSNSASVAPPTGVTDPNMGNNTAGPVQTTVVASVPTQADLSATISGPSIVAPNGTVTYVVTITNAGPAAGNNAPISDVLPAVLTNITAVCGNTVGGATCGAVAVNGKTVSSTIGALPVGASLTLTITATAPASGTFSNSASVGAAPGETDPNTANNVAGPVVTTIGAATGIANLGISKTGPDMAGAGSSFSYTLLVSNAGPAAANGALVSDAVPTGLTNIHAVCSAPTNGAVCGPVQVAGQNVTSAVQSLPALGTVTITVTVTAPVPTGLQPTTVVNRATITPPPGINDPDTSDNVSNAVETSIVSAGVSGTVWLDINHDKKLDAGDPLLANWIVELFHNGVLVVTTTTNAQGQYSFSGVPPGPGYSIDFRDPGSKAIYGTPTNGNEGVPNPDSNAVIGNGVIQSITLKPGINIVQQSLPVDPSGVVYDATVRTPVGGATVTLVGPAGFNPATELVGGIANATQITESTGPTAGAYQFLLISPGQPGGAPAGSYTIVVTAPAGYLPTPAKLGGVSQPGSSFTVPGPISATTAIQPQEGPPKVGDNGAGTIYYFNLVFNPGSGAVINNNIPLDRISGGALTVQKTGSTATADIGETVLYTVDVTSTVGLLPNVTVTDRLPRGFTLIPGTIMINGVKAADPKVNNDGVLSFALGNIAASVTVEIKYRVRIGVGAQQGDGINRAQASNPLGATSNVATFKVDVNGGVFTTNGGVVGKVFIDCNNNQIQDDNEIGIPGVRLYFSDGTFVVTDSEGKFSYFGLRPTTHTLKVDKTTLPPGSHLVESSNRNALDPNSLFIDLKAGELQQANFIEGSCSPQVIEETKARRGQGEVNAAQPQKAAAPALIFDSKPINSNTPAAKPAAGGAP